MKKDMSHRAIQLIHYFARDTVEKILQHIQRMDIQDTHALRNSIKSVVHTNASGNQMLVQFFYLFYGDCVEQAVGRYRGIDSDLPKGQGLKSENVGAPQITGRDYGAMQGIIKGVPATTPSGKNRGDYHRPRPFLRSEIRRSVDRIGFRLMSQCGELISIHMINTIAEAIGDEGLLNAMLLSPYEGQERKAKQYSWSSGLGEH